MGNSNSISTYPSTPTLPFDPQEFPREASRHYISATEQEIKDMLSTIGLTELSQLFAHINPTLLFPQPLYLPEEQTYQSVANEMASIASLSNHKLSFIGDQLPSVGNSRHYRLRFKLRNLSTSYTPYQQKKSRHPHFPAGYTVCNVGTRIQSYQHFSL